MADQPVPGTLPARPRMKKHVSVVPIARDAVIIRGPGIFVRLAGEGVGTLRSVLPHLSGEGDVADVARRAGVPEEDVRDIVEALAHDRAIEDAADDDAYDIEGDARDALASQLNLFSHLLRRPASAQNRLTAATVVVIGVGPTGRAVAETLVRSGIGTVRLVAPADGRGAADALVASTEQLAVGTAVHATTLSVATLREAMPQDFLPVVEGADHVVLALESPASRVAIHVNDACLRANVTWTPVVMDALDATVGPTVIPRATACWRCYDMRVKGAHPNMDRLMAVDHVMDEGGIGEPAACGLPGFAMLAGTWAANAVLLTVSRAVRPPLAGQAFRLSFMDFRAEKHRVLRIPRCPACTDANVPDVDRYSLEPVTFS